MTTVLLPSEYLWIAGVATFSLVYLYAEGHVRDNLARRKQDNGKAPPAAVPIPRAAAVEAVEKVKDWAIWITGLSTAAMAAIALLIKDQPPTSLPRRWVFLSLLFFCASVLLATWVLASLPSLLLRLRPSESGENDVYRMTIFSFVKFRLGPMTGLQHTYFLIGVVCFAALVFVRFSQGDADRSRNGPNAVRVAEAEAERLKAVDNLTKRLENPAVPDEDKSAIRRHLAR